MRSPNSGSCMGASHLEPPCDIAMNDQRAAMPNGGPDMVRGRVNVCAARWRPQLSGWGSTTRLTPASGQKQSMARSRGRSCARSANTCGWFWLPEDARTRDWRQACRHNVLLFSLALATREHLTPSASICPRVQFLLQTSKVLIARKPFEGQGRRRRGDTRLSKRPST